MATTLLGIDVSKNQGDIDFAKVLADTAKQLGLALGLPGDTVVDAQTWWMLVHQGND